MPKFAQKCCGCVRRSARSRFGSNKPTTPMLANALISCARWFKPPKTLPYWPTTSACGRGISKTSISASRGHLPKTSLCWPRSQPAAPTKAPSLPTIASTPALTRSMKSNRGSTSWLKLRPTPLAAIRRPASERCCIATAGFGKRCKGMTPALAINSKNHCDLLVKVGVTIRNKWPKLMMTSASLPKIPATSPTCWPGMVKQASCEWPCSAICTRKPCGLNIMSPLHSKKVGI